jgi:hypothetical protein
MGQPPVSETPPTQAPQKATKPEGIPDKFWDAEKGEVRVADLAKAHAELERKQGQPAKPVEQPKPAPSIYAQKALLADKGIAVEEIEKLTPEQVKAKFDELSAPVADPAKAAAEAKGVDFTKLSDEYAQGGKLSDATYADLAAKGFDKSVVDSYIAGQVALAAQYDQKGITAAGGEKQFAAMQAWAAANVPANELAAYNEAVASMDEGRMTLAVAGMRSRYEAANGTKPNLINGGNTPASGDAPFQSIAEQKAAQSDPRYKTDPAYRAQVYARIAASNYNAVQVVGA